MSRSAYDERDIRASLHAALDNQPIPDGLSERIANALPQEHRTSHKRVGAFIFAAAMLLFSIAVASGLLWPELFGRVMPSDVMSDRGRVILEMMETYGGHEVQAEAESAGIHMRTHFMVSDGSDVSVFFSLENESGDEALFREIPLGGMMSASGETEYGSDMIMTVDVSEDGESGLLYGMVSGSLQDGNGEPLVLEEGELLQLKVFNLGPDQPTIVPLCDVTEAGIAALPTNRPLAMDSPVSSLTVQEAILDNNKLSVRYSITPESEEHGAYLVVLPPDVNALTLEDIADWQQVNGEGTLAHLDVEDGSRLALVTVTHGRFSETEPSFDFTVPVRISQETKVLDVPLDVAYERGGVTLHIRSAQVRQASLMLMCEIVESELPEKLLPVSGKWSMKDGSRQEIREAAYGIHAKVLLPDGSQVALSRTDMRMQFPGTWVDGYEPPDYVPAFTVMHKYMGMLPAELAGVTLELYGKEGEILASVELD